MHVARCIYKTKIRKMMRRFCGPGAHVELIPDCSDVELQSLQLPPFLMTTVKFQKVQSKTAFGNDFVYLDPPTVRPRCQNCFGSQKNIVNLLEKFFVRAAGDTMCV